MEKGTGGEGQRDQAYGHSQQIEGSQVLHLIPSPTPPEPPLPPPPLVPQGQVPGLGPPCQPSHVTPLTCPQPTP